MTDARTRRTPRKRILIHEDQLDGAAYKAAISEDELNDGSECLDGSRSSKSDSSDEEDDLDDGVREDMRQFEDTFKGITKKYKLIGRIGEGTFSTVYKAEDLHYHQFRNDWDLTEKENAKWSPSSRKIREHQKAPHFVAIKKIYVTSSPLRVMNELDLLHELRNCASICPLITAFRHQDQVIAVLPYFKHQDFREYFRELGIADMRVYFRSLFTALAAVHREEILHRDVKPTNFLYDTHRRRGVLVDFGLAERQGTDYQPCLCELTSEDARLRMRTSYNARHPMQGQYPKEDRRPSLRANRAGTRGFRAPEVLFKCTAQTTKIDVWSAGVMLLTILAKRFPFFHSADDVDAVVELTTVFGKDRMSKCALSHGQLLETNIPTLGDHGHSFQKIIFWSLNRPNKDKNGNKYPLKLGEEEAYDFMEKCMVLDARNRISAEEALAHPFLIEKGSGSEDEMDILSM